MPRTLFPALAAVLLCTGAHSAAAQSDPSPGLGPTPMTERDSARAVRTARAEQARFERVRRNHLPWAWGGGGGECDERIGRFCLTHSRGESTWEPEPEADEIRSARERLIQHLGAASRHLPGDPWIAGQRIRYLVEAGRHDEARDAAAECRANGWWCDALRGFAHHYAGEAADADSAFSAMLIGMPDEDRRRWTELEMLLDPSAIREYRRLRGAERERFEERFWRMADPFQSAPGNEIRSEHFARHVWDQLQDRAKSAEGISWGDDLRQILLRYGWPQGWERIRSRPGDLGPPALLSHYADSDDLLPPADPFAGEWDVGWRTDRHVSRTGYSLPAADSVVQWIRPLHHQLAVFRRGDTAVLVAAYALPPDSVPEGTEFEAALALSAASGEAPQVVRFAAGGLSDVVTAELAPGPALVSLEVLGMGARHAARLRQGLEIPAVPRGLPSVSDLLVLRSPDLLPDSLEQAVTATRTSDRVRAGERVGVYWEVYGLRPGQPEALRMSLRLVEEGAGWLRRLARRIGLVDRAPPVQIRWREHPSGLAVLPRSMAVQLPDDLAPGRYALELTLSLPGREELTVRRGVQVETTGKR